MIMGNEITAANAATVRSMVSATVVMDNSAAGDDRAYDVQAEVTVRGTTVEAVNNGVVRERSETQAQVADFSTYDPHGGQMLVGFSGGYAESTTSRVAIMTAIDSLMAGTSAAAGSILNVEF